MHILFCYFSRCSIIVVGHLMAFVIVSSLFSHSLSLLGACALGIVQYFGERYRFSAHLSCMWARERDQQLFCCSISVSSKHSLCCTFNFNSFKYLYREKTPIRTHTRSVFRVHHFWAIKCFINSANDCASGLPTDHQPIWIVSRTIMFRCAHFYRSCIFVRLLLLVLLVLSLLLFSSKIELFCWPVV